MEIKDVAGLSKPVTKLIEVIEKGVGNVFKPWMIRRIGNANADVIKTISASILENQSDTLRIEYSDGAIKISPIELVQGKTDLSLPDRTMNRLVYQEQKKLINIESIAQKASKLMDNETVVSDEPVNDDWITRFFNYAGDVSEDEMQVIWARILAGEVIRPKSYSLRTLQLLSNLTKEEARTFVKVAKYALIDPSDGVACIYRENNDFLKQFNIGYLDLENLRYLAILSYVDNTVLNLHDTSKKQILHLVLRNTYYLLIEKEPQIPKRDIPVIIFSPIGQELLNLVEEKPDFKYLQLLASNLKRKQISVKYAEIVNYKSTGEFKYSTPLKEVPDLSSAD